MIRLVFLIIFIVDDITIYANDLLIIAHRGGNQNHPENTMYAFENAIKLGVDGIELDIQLTKDEQVVVYHPNCLSKNTNGSGEIKDMIYKDIAVLDNSYKFDPSRDQTFPMRGKGHTIPLLSDVLRAFHHKLIIIDFKSLPIEPIVDATIQVVNKIGWDNIIFYSTDYRHIKYLLHKIPGAKVFEDRSITRKRLLNRIANHTCCCRNFAKYIGYELNRLMCVEERMTLGNEKECVYFNMWNADTINCIRTQTDGIKIFFFGVNDENSLKAAFHFKVDAIFTDNPHKIISFLRKLA